MLIFVRQLVRSKFVQSSQSSSFWLKSSSNQSGISQQSVSTQRAIREQSVSTQSIKIRVNTVGAYKYFVLFFFKFSKQMDNYKFSSQFAESPTEPTWTRRLLEAFRLRSENSPGKLLSFSPDQVCRIKDAVELWWVTSMSSLQLIVQVVLTPVP